MRNRTGSDVGAYVPALGLYTDGEATVCVAPGLEPCEEELIWRLTEARGHG